MIRFFNSRKSVSFFSIRKILFKRLFEIFEKNDVSTSVFNIVIRRTNRFYAVSKFEIFLFKRFNSIENAAWNDLNVSIVINVIKYVYFRDLIFMIITFANIIIDCLFFFDLIDDCDCDSFSILEFKIDVSWTFWFWSKFKISFIFKSIWKKDILSIIFALNLWFLFEIISKIKR